MNRFGKRMLALVGFLILGVSQTSNAQGIPFLPTRGGTVTGTVKAPGNLPAASVRVSAMDSSDKLTDIGAQQSIVSLGETDAEGHFRLEDIPPGRYFIIAGRVDNPTYYPGTTELDKAKPVLVTAGTTVSGVDFLIEGLSIRVLDQRSSNTSIPIEVVGEGSSRIPIFANGNFVVIRWSRKDGVGVQARLTDVSVNVPLYPTGVSEYQVTVENLPLGFSVKSITYGSINLNTNSVALNPPSRGAAVAPNIASTLRVVLASNAASNVSAGVRITGKTANNGVRSIYISGKPGIFYSDGTFEFRSVAAGRQTILLFDPEQTNTSGPRGAWILLAARNIVVGDKDMEGVELLEPISILPMETASLMAPGPSTVSIPGPIPFVTIRGRATGEQGEPIPSGSAIIQGQNKLMLSLDSEGRFTVPNLLPGTYKIEIGGFGYQTIRETINVEYEDLELNLTTPKL